LAGINPDENYPGCERMIITPYIPESLPFVNASVETVKGKVAVQWKQDGSELHLKIEIPVGMKANVHIPVNKALGQTISKGTNPKNNNIQFIGETEKYKQYLVNSGSYNFVVMY
jgi:hypothetical protein